MPKSLPLPPSGVARAPWLLLGALCLLGMGVRFWTAAHAAWYWDEGYVAQIALDLGRTLRPRAGAVWANGLRPLTASWLAPLSASPFALAWPTEPIVGIRLWAILLGGATVAGIGAVGFRLGGPVLGLGAAALLALGAFPAALGGIGLYHPLGSVLAVAAFGLALQQDDGRSRAPHWLPWLAAGLAMAACYWLWWVPLGLALRRRERGWRQWAPALLLGFGPGALALGAALLTPGAWGMFERLAGYSGKLSPRYLIPAVYFYPGVWLGLAGLLFLRGRRWIAAAVLLAMLDAVRQRGNISGSPYILLPMLPWACLGLAAGAARLGSRGRAWLAAGLLAAWAVLLLGPTDWLARIGADAAMVRNVRNFIRTQPVKGWNVVAMPVVGSALRTYCDTSELAQTTAFGGRESSFLPAGLPKAAFSHDASMRRSALLVVGRADFSGLWMLGANAFEVLVAEQEGWPQVFQNPQFRVFANPRFLGRRAADSFIMLDPEFYAVAAKEAEARGRRDLVEFAARRSRETPLNQGPAAAGLAGDGTEKPR